MTAPLPLLEAQARLFNLVSPLAVEAVRVEESLGRYLATPLIARRTQPPADLSAMDGYAIAGPGPWRILGESRCGAPYAGNIGPGETVQISTGAAVPLGADRVALREIAHRSADTLTVVGELPVAGQHIRRRGFDFSERETLLAAGTRIGPAQIAAILSAGWNRIEVRRKPRLTLIDSGDELSPDAESCTEDQIPASNGAMLAAMAMAFPAEIHRIGPIPDSLEAIVAAFDAGGESDLIVTSGGASVGDHDLIRPALEEWGAELQFWRVNIKPGKPLLVARRGPQIILGLPGNPVSSYTTAFLFLLPLLRHLSGSHTPCPQTIMMPIGTDLPATGPRREFIRAAADGAQVLPLGEQDSSALRALAMANAFIERPENSPEAKAGTDVPVYLLQNG